LVKKFYHAASYRAFYDATACERHTTLIGMSLLLAEQLLPPLLRA
jgi:hypothetical protein